jgi:hypothetical protein
MVTPGEAYRIEDVALFRQLEAFVHASGLSREDGQSIVAVLADAVKRRINPEHCLLGVVQVIPALQFLLDARPVDRFRLARASGMILAVVTSQTRQGRRGSDWSR